MKAVLVGNYGVGNFGDEALKAFFLEHYPEVQWTVLSTSPHAGEVPPLPCGIRSLFQTPWWRTVAAIRRSDALVFGGGTLFTDVESVWACVVWGWHACVARLFGVRVIVAFQGIGPFHSRLGEGIARWVLRRSSALSVRDPASLSRVHAWGLSTEVIHTFDPIFLSFLSHKREHRAQNVYVLIPRHTSGPAFLQALDQHAVNLRHVAIVIALFQPDDRRERRVVEALRTRYPHATVRIIRATDDLMELLSTASHCICERFHGALAAVAAGVPLTIIPQAAGDKLEGVLALLQPGMREEARTRAEAGERALRAALSH